MTFDFGAPRSTARASPSTPITQDGYTTGRLISIDTDNTGVVQARFTNGRSLGARPDRPGQFANPNGLQQLGDTNWSGDLRSGQALRGPGRQSGLGVIQSGALEASNVDITEQLVR
jgi:flagellar hook protein FlgE